MHVSSAGGFIRSVCLGLPLLALFAGAGCKNSDRPEIGRVRGTVTLDGEPLPMAVVFFRPTEGGRTSTAITDDQGQYDLIYIGTTMGAKVGPHDVRIKTAGEASDEEGNTYTTPELVPSRYNDQTELHVVVEPGDNSFDFPLEGGLQPQTQ